jgi:tetratricopeptide (TPR) repeat protein
MNLRVVFPARQLLSAAASLLLLVVGGTAFAQGQQAAAAGGGDTITLKTNPPQRKSGVTVTSVAGTRVMVREGTGEIGYDLAQLESVVKAAPPEFVQGMRFVEAGDAEKALPLLKNVADRFKGLPTVWAQDATAAVGNLYLSLNKVPEAEAAFADLKKAYGGSNSAAATVGEARLAAAKGKFADARGLVEPIAKEALTKKNISRSESQLYGQAYFVLGQVAEGENKLPEAMENYCRTVAIFYQERSVVAEAQKRIDDLRRKDVATP